MEQHNKFFVAIYDHEDGLISAVRKLRAEKVSIYDALTPFPIHFFENEIGYKDTNLHTAGFFFGITGTTFALSLMSFIHVFNYPSNFGGKPFFALPAFIPVTFEMTVLFAAIGMTVTYCVRNRIWPGKKPRIFDERTTDDKFALTFVIDGKNDEEIEALKSAIQATQPSEINVKDFS